MKRALYDSEYERVRQKSALGRKPQAQEFPDDDEPVDRAAVAERVATSNAEFREEMAKLSEHERARAAEAKQRADEFSHRASTSIMVQEYQRRGLTPPFTNPDGTPKFSLAFLLKLGWSIETFGGSSTLVKPERFR
jgi:hypothetical protein